MKLRPRSEVCAFPVGYKRDMYSCIYEKELKRDCLLLTKKRLIILWSAITDPVVLVDETYSGITWLLYAEVLSNSIFVLSISTANYAV